jgi:hypothetical protein
MFVYLMDLPAWIGLTPLRLDRQAPAIIPRHPVAAQHAASHPHSTFAQT